MKWDQQKIYIIEDENTDQAKDGPIEPCATKIKKYVALKVVDTVFKGEQCKAVYFYCMRHQVDAMLLQSAQNRRHSSY